MQDADSIEDAKQGRRVRSLLTLFSLYCAALLAVMILSDAADVGSILAAIAARDVTAARTAMVAHFDQLAAVLRELGLSEHPIGAGTMTTAAIQAMEQPAPGAPAGRG